MQSFTRLARPVLARSTRQCTRTFTTFTPLRPSLTQTTLAIRPNITSFTPSPATTTATGAAAAADLVPTTAISSHPALGGGVSQLRCGPRNTMNGHTRLIQKRRSGFLSRMKSKSGRRILMRRKLKGRRKVGW